MPILSDKQQLEKKIATRFQKAIYGYQLIEDNDRILVGLSGGKDSLCLLEMLSKRQQIFKPQFALEAVHIRMRNIKYETDTSYLERFCLDRGVKLHVEISEFNSSTDNRKTPCFLCSWNRRKRLFEMAQELKCNKIALGHHLDDIVHTTMMNLFFQGSFSTMPIKLKMTKMPITIIRPLCLECEDDLRNYAQFNNYAKQIKACPYENCSQRTVMKRIFNEIENQNKEARYSVLNALEKECKLIEE